jgi:hypothetical protein
MKKTFLLVIAAVALLGSGCENKAINTKSTPESTLEKISLAKSCSDLGSIMSHDLFTTIGCDDKDFNAESENETESMIRSCILDRSFTKEHKKFAIENTVDYSVVFRCGIADEKIHYVLLKQAGLAYQIVNIADDTTKKDEEMDAEKEQSLSLIDLRHKERLQVIVTKLLNTEYDPKIVTIDRNDEGTSWDHYERLGGLGGDVGYVEKVNDRGEFIVSTIVGDGDQKILNLFHFLPMKYSVFPYSLGLNKCQRESQIDFLRKNVVGKKVGLRSHEYGPKFFAGSVGIFVNDEGDSFNSMTQPLDMLLAEEGYLPKIESSENQPILKRAIEIAKVKQNGFWGTCK